MMTGQNICRNLMLALLLYCGPVLAYEVYGPPWENSGALIYVDIPGASPSGITWEAGFSGATKEWNDVASGFSFNISPQFSDPCAGILVPEDNFRNGVGFRSTACDLPFNADTLAITYTYFSTSGDYIIESDIIFNSNVEWDIYTGPVEIEFIDFKRVATHELGHFAGLDHEDDTLALMNSTESDIERPLADDIAGMQSLYPSGQAPPIFKVSLEEPLDSEVHGGIGNLRGWAISEVGVDRVEMWLNGSFLFEVPYGGDRPDVAAAFPNVTGSQQTGFSMAFGYSNLGAGTHTMTARAYTLNGDVEESSSTFSVIALHKDFVSATDEVRTEGGSCSLSSDEIQLNDVSIAGKMYDLQLKWRTAEQGFEIIQTR